MTWGKIASWGVAAAMAAGFGPAVSQAQATVHAAAFAGPPAGYANDGEWATRSQYRGHWPSNGDSGPCWSDAPVAVPRYFAYLQRLGVGMTVWTLSDGGPGIGTTAASDPGTFTTTATMAGWPGCVAVTPVRVPGALIMAWFGRQAG